MEITVDVTAEIKSSLSGEPNEVFSKIERLERVLGEIGLKANLGVRYTRPMGLVADRPDFSTVLIEDLTLGVRSYNMLKRAGVQTIGELIAKSRAEVEGISNMGKKSADEIEEALKDRGLKLQDN
jgi:DNA-directed RNA polymerase subunit alpha